jgi:hypothetical protein
MTWLLAVLLAAPAAAQSLLVNAAPGDYIRLLSGVVSFGVNEMAVRAIGPDASGFGIEGSNIPTIGQVIGRFVDSRGNARAVAQILFKKDERTRYRDDLAWGEFAILIYGPPDPTIPNDDGARVIFLATHDYTWIRGFGPPNPDPPAIALPPPPASTPPPTLPTDERAERLLDLAAMRQEFAPIELDEGAIVSYLAGRSTPAEFHGDLQRRADGQHRPEFHRVGRGY